jgi:hypothetical protein
LKNAALLTAFQVAHKILLLFLPHDAIKAVAHCSAIQRARNTRNSWRELRLKMFACIATANLHCHQSK